MTTLRENIKQTELWAGSVTEEPNLPKLNISLFYIFLKWLNMTILNKKNINTALRNINQILWYIIQVFFDKLDCNTE